jgi:hypothetical protein
MTEEFCGAHSRNYSVNAQVSYRHFARSALTLPCHSELVEESRRKPHAGFPYWDEPTLLKTLQCMVLVGEKSLQQQALQAVPENGVALTPFETAGNTQH